MADDSTSLSIAELRNRLNSGEISAHATVDQHLQRIADRTHLNAFIHVMSDAARSAADSVDRGDVSGPLAGIPIAVKDNILVENEPCTCGSRMLAEWVAPYDATAVARLRAAGAVIIGKTNQDEFGMGSTNEHSHFGAAHNPANPDHVTGGSSGGSAVAVADHQAVAALGSDTGGSVRLPAAYCGCVGLKPTYGAVSRWGLVAYASSLDQIGVLARCVDDARRVFHVIRGHDPRDATSDRSEPRATPDAHATIGIPRDVIDEGLDPRIRDAVMSVAERLQERGHSLVDVALPSLKYAVAAYYIIACAEASSNLARYDGVAYGHRTANAEDLIAMFESTRDEAFGAEVKRRILLGTYVLSSGYVDQYYGTALRTRAHITAEFNSVLAGCDCLLMPTAPSTAPALGQQLQDPLEMYLLDIYTTSANLTGLPAISIPCGTDANGLPIGAQLMGRAFDEARLLQIAAQGEISGEAVA